MKTDNSSLFEMSCFRYEMNTIMVACLKCLSCAKNVKILLSEIKRDYNYCAYEIMGI